MARISYTEKEVELLARLIKSEALGEGEEGMLLVGNAVAIVLSQIVTFLEMSELLVKLSIRQINLLE